MASSQNVDGFPTRHPSLIGYYTKFTDNVRRCVGQFFYYLTNINRDHKLSSALIERSYHRIYWSSDQLFMCLCQFAPDRRLAIADLSLEIAKGRLNSVRRFEEHDRSSNGSHSLEPVFAVF